MIDRRFGIPAEHHDAAFDRRFGIPAEHHDVALDRRFGIPAEHHDAALDRRFGIPAEHHDAAPPTSCSYRSLGFPLSANIHIKGIISHFLTLSDVNDFILRLFIFFNYRPFHVFSTQHSPILIVHV